MRLLKTHSSRIRCRFLWNHCMVLKGIYRFSRGVISFLSWIRFSFLVFFCLFPLGNCLFCLYETNPSVTHTYTQTQRKKKKTIASGGWGFVGLRGIRIRKEVLMSEEECWSGRKLLTRSVFISLQVLSSCIYFSSSFVEFLVRKEWEETMPRNVLSINIYLERRPVTWHN